MSKCRKISLQDLIKESRSEEDSKKNKYIETIIDILFIIFWIVVIKYINDLEKNCKCSDNWKRDFIKYSLIIFVIFLLLKILFTKKLYEINKNILLLIILLNFVFTFVVLFYINELKENECKCSESNIRTIFEIVNYIRLFIMIIGLIGFIYLYFKIFRNFNKK